MSHDQQHLSDDDLRALERLVIEYAWRVDHGHADTAYELFAAEGVLVLGPQQMNGRDEIAAWGANRSSIDRTTRHICTNIRFVPDGQGGATGTTVLTVYLSDGTGDGVSSNVSPHSVADYEDTFVRVEGEWRFASRLTNVLFSSAG
jgi:hypothetical protein